MLGSLALFALAAFLLLQLALHRLPAQVAAALGPRASVQAIEVGWRGVEVLQLVVRGDGARWPAEHELRADRVLIEPTWQSLWRGPWRMSRIRVEGAYVSMLRQRDGRLIVLPSLIGPQRATGAAPPAAPPLRELVVDAVELRGATVDFFDATVAPPRGAPHRMRLAELKADVGPVVLPALDEPMAIELDAAFKGVQRDGRLTARGQLTPATRDAALKVEARGVDLVALQPYFLRRGEAAVRHGALDMTLDAKVAQQKLRAPGKLTIHNLELQSGSGLLGTFSGVPVQAVLAAMSRDGRIDLAFTLEGQLDDPKFSLNELFAARFAVGLAQKLGASVEGVVEGVGSLIKGLFGK